MRVRLEVLYISCDSLRHYRVKTREKLSNWDLEDDFVCHCNKQGRYGFRAFMFADSMPMPVADKYSQLPLAQAAPPTLRSKIVAHFFFSHVSDFGKMF
jgi:hypothetical protein